MAEFDVVIKGGTVVDGTDIDAVALAITPKALPRSSSDTLWVSRTLATGRIAPLVMPAITCSVPSITTVVENPCRA